MAIRHWSYSALRQYLECPLRFFFQRILAMPERAVSVNLVSGSAVHAALAMYHQMIQRKEPIQLDQLRQVIQETWTEKERNVRVIYKDESRAEGIEKANALIQTYLRETPPANIVGIEKEITTQVPNSRGELVSTPVMAILDLVTEDNGEITVQEFKTSGRAYSESEAAMSLQPTCYSAVIHGTRGVIPRVEYTILVKTKTPRVQRLPTIREEDDIERLGDLIETVERAIENDVFYPIESPMHCSGCSYRKACREWGGSMTTTPEMVERSR